MKKLKSRFFKPLAVALIAVIALTSVIPIGATDSNSSQLILPEGYSYVDLSDGTVSVSQEEIDRLLFSYDGTVEYENSRSSSYNFTVPVLDPPALSSSPKGGSTVTVGTNATLSSADHGQNGGAQYLAGTYFSSHNLPTRQHYVSSQSYLIGSAAASSTTGESFYVTGSSARSAYIYFVWMGGRDSGGRNQW